MINRPGETDNSPNNTEDLTAEEVRQGRIILYNWRRKLIFFGGLALLIIVVLALRFTG